jgi:hypothetical protein
LRGVFQDVRPGHEVSGFIVLHLHNPAIEGDVLDDVRLQPRLVLAYFIEHPPLLVRDGLNLIHPFDCLGQKDTVPAAGEAERIEQDQ